MRIEAGEYVGTRPDRKALMAMSAEEREKALQEYRKMQAQAPLGIKEASSGEFMPEVQTVRNVFTYIAEDPSLEDGDF